MNEFHTHDTQIRLIPCLRQSPFTTERINYTSIGMFSLSSYSEFNHRGKVIDTETDEITDDDIYILWVVLSLNDVPIYHMVAGVEEEGELYDGFALESVKIFSQFVHEQFGLYLDGGDSNFPLYRSLGWNYVEVSLLPMIAMQEHRGIVNAITADIGELDKLADIVSYYLPRQFKDDPDLEQPNVSSTFTDFINSIGDPDDDIE